MTAEQFDAIAATCRWGARSLAVVREILVDGASLSDTAAKHELTAKHARVLLSRFHEKAGNRLKSFMEREQPKHSRSMLAPFSSEIHTLKKGGYTIDQIVSFLAENGVTASPTTVRNFLRSQS